MKEIRLLRAEEIECRVGVIKENGLSLLLYKDARVDQKILDEIFTPFGWQRIHQVIGDNLYCTVKVWDERKNQWIEKQDVGVASNAEAEKGQASDSFKRACVNWGIGRELYSAPFIWISADKAGIKSKNNRWYTTEEFHVSRIEYDNDRVICVLVIVNSRGQKVYCMETGDGAHTAPVQGQKNNVAGLTASQKEAMDRELKRTGVALETVLARYGIQNTKQMTEDIYKSAMKGLKRTRDVPAAA